MSESGSYSPSSDSVDISVVIPAFNEGAAIGDTVSALRALGLPRSEVLVVDDGSSDNTGEAAAQAGARVIRHPYNIGNGAAVKTGIRESRGEVLVFMDGDGQHDPADVPRLLSLIGKFHMVIGARSKGSETHLHRDLANILYNKLASFAASFHVLDLTSGFRAIRRRDALRFCDMLPNGFSYPTTITLAFLRSGRSITYVPIKTRYRVGKSKIRLVSDGFEFLIIIMKIVMTFSPLRVFIPVSSFLFFLGVLRYGYTYITEGKFTNMSHLMINSAVIVFMLGMVAEQIASLRMERGDSLSPEPERSRLNDIAAHGENHHLKS